MLLCGCGSKRCSTMPFKSLRKYNRWRQAWRIKRRVRGLCWHHQRKAADGHSSCEQCLEDARLNWLAKQVKVNTMGDSKPASPLGQNMAPDRRLAKAIAVVSGKLSRAKKSPVILSWEDAELVLAALTGMVLQPASDKPERS